MSGYLFMRMEDGEYKDFGYIDEGVSLGEVYGRDERMDELNGGFSCEITLTDEAREFFEKQNEELRKYAQGLPDGIKDAFSESLKERLL